MEKMSKDKKMAGIICVVGLLFFMLVLGYFQNKSINYEFGTVQNDSKEQIEARMKEKVDPSILAVSMEQTIIMQNGDAEAELNIENMPENNYTIDVEIKNSDDENIYSVKQLEPRYIIRSDTLDQRLIEGDYVCKAIFTAYDQEGTKAKEATAQIQIIVQG